MELGLCCTAIFLLVLLYAFYTNHIHLQNSVGIMKEDTFIAESISDIVMEYDTLDNDNGCRDSMTYRNPFNDFTCADHSSSDCGGWEYFLTQDQLDDLLYRCPESCNVTCLM